MTSTIEVLKFPPPPPKVLLNSDAPDDEFQMYAIAAVPPKKEGWTRIWVDGCFDMLHFGHTNALRQARALGPEGKTELFVGSHSDKEICKVKGPPIMHEEERYEALRGCKWVDFVIENYPYSTRLKDMIRFEIDFVAHGDDISVGADGRNSYQEIIDAGKFKVFKRTDGISTTDLVGRMLLCTKSHMVEQVSEEVAAEVENPKTNTKLSYLTTSRKIAQFTNNTAPQDSQKIVYVVGGFDLFHFGHMRLLKLAREIIPNAYVIAGVCYDAVINKHKHDTNYPIMNLNERVLGVLSCRYVDEVIMGVPYDVNDELIEKLAINYVVVGSVHDRVDIYHAPAHNKEDGGFPNEPSSTTAAGGVGARSGSGEIASAGHSPTSTEEPYAAARKRGILRQVDTLCDLTTSTLIDRVVSQLPEFVARQKKKSVKDKESMKNRPKEYENVKEVA